MSFNHFTDQIFDDTIIENKIAAISANELKDHHDFLYPYNLTVFKIMPTLDNIRMISGLHTDKYDRRCFSFQFISFIVIIISFSYACL